MLSAASKRGADEHMPQRIETGTPEGDLLDFTEALFSGWVELFEDNRLYLHFIISRQKIKGNTQRLLAQWIRDGYDVRIVKPRDIMQHIAKKFGFIPAYERLPAYDDDEVEVWRKPSLLDLLTQIDHPHMVMNGITAVS
jgi:hypothetical protein